jgi:queuine tRNA-ribosyltransferase
VETPAFIPVGSQATVKTLVPDDIKELGYKMLLANTYHLYLRPGIEIIEKVGGLHKFMAWDGATLTDSGGYQVFSLAPLNNLYDEGVTFRSHIDGSSHHLTPERVVALQESLGSDVMMVLDECPPIDAPYNKVQTAVERTRRWAERCMKAWKRHELSLFGIVQGGLFADLRTHSAESLVGLGFPGYAIGGLSIGEAKEVTYEMVDNTIIYLPEDKPRYLMGVGAPEDILEGVARGVDMFDSALPTRLARNGALFTHRGRVNISNARFRIMDAPLEENCSCYVCTNFSSAYLHHLFNTKELLAYRLATIHNLYFISCLMANIRTSITEGGFDNFMSGFLSSYRTTDEEVRLTQKKRWFEKPRRNEVE